VPPRARKPMDQEQFAVPPQLASPSSRIAQSASRHGFLRIGTAPGCVGPSLRSPQGLQPGRSAEARSRLWRSVGCRSSTPGRLVVDRADVGSPPTVRRTRLRPTFVDTPPSAHIAAHAGFRERSVTTRILVHTGWIWRSLRAVSHGSVAPVICPDDAYSRRGQRGGVVLGGVGVGVLWCVCVGGRWGWVACPRPRNGAARRRVAARSSPRRGRTPSSSRGRSGEVGRLARTHRRAPRRRGHLHQVAGTRSGLRSPVFVFFFFSGAGSTPEAHADSRTTRCRCGPCGSGVCTRGFIRTL